jgi:hypothetical protein
MNTNTHKFLLGLVAGIFAATLSTACHTYSIDTPDAMVQLNESKYSTYEYRATTPDGVILSSRVIQQGSGRDIPQGSLEFWADAFRLRMRTGQAYALVDEEEIRSADGTPGILMHFGRDLGSEPYVYNVALFTTDRHLHVVEFGGRSSLVEEHADSLDRALRSYRIRR